MIKKRSHEDSGPEGGDIYIINGHAKPQENNSSVREDQRQENIEVEKFSLKICEKSSEWKRSQNTE